MKQTVIILLTLFISTLNLEAKRKYYPATIYLLSGKTISTNISTSIGGTRNKLSYKNDLSEDAQKMDCHNIDYIIIHSGNNNYELKYGNLSIPISKKKALTYKKKRWFARINKSGGDKVGMYAFANNYYIDKKGRLNLRAEQLVFCISKRSERLGIGVYQGGSYSQTIENTPTFSFVSTRKFKLKVIKKFFSEEPSLAIKLEKEDMRWEEICDTYQSLLN